MKENAEKIERILLLRLSALGDCLAAIPVFVELRERFPHAHIAWAIQDNFAPLIRNLPGLDELIIFPRQRWRAMPSSLNKWKEALRFIRRLRMRKFDVTVDVQSNTKSSALAYFTRAPLRIGHGEGEAKEISRWFTNCPVKPTIALPHILQRNLRLLSPLGINVSDPEFRIPVDPAASLEVTQWLKESHIHGRPFVVLVPFCGNTNKEWPGGYFTKLGSLLAQQHIPAVFLCGPGKKEQTSSLIPKDAGFSVILGPDTTIPQMVELIRQSAVVVGGDTGPIQIAGALGVNTVSIFGPTDPKRSHPWGPTSIHQLNASPEMLFQSVMKFVRSIDGAANEPQSR